MFRRIDIRKSPAAVPVILSNNIILIEWQNMMDITSTRLRRYAVRSSWNVNCSSSERLDHNLWCAQPMKNTKNLVHVAISSRCTYTTTGCTRDGRQSGSFIHYTPLRVHRWRLQLHDRYRGSGGRARARLLGGGKTNKQVHLSVYSCTAAAVVKTAVSVPYNLILYRKYLLRAASYMYLRIRHIHTKYLYAIRLCRGGTYMFIK